MRRHMRKFYAAIVDLAISQRPVDMLTVTEQLKKRGELEEVGGPFYISQLTSRLPVVPISNIMLVSSPKNIWRVS